MTCGSKCEDRKTERRKTQVQWRAWTYAQYAGETERERERKHRKLYFKNSNSMYMSVFNEHVLYKP